MLGGLADKVFGRLGYVLMRQENYEVLRGHLGWERLGTIPNTPKTVIDVGVAYGTPELYDAFPDAYLILVEPLKEYQPTIDAILAKRAGRHHAVAAGAEEKEIEIHVESKDHMKSSFLDRTEASRTGDATSLRRVSVKRLDTVLRGADLAGPVLLKIDVEGFEKEVLLGAPETLQRMDWVIIETSIAKRFEHGPPFAEIIRMMEQAGFGLYDIVNVARTNDPGARHADLLFRRPAR